jgi:hypothetical protein
VGAGCGQILRRAFGKIIVITAVNRISRARLEPPSGGCGERPKISFQRLQGICDVILCQTTHINRNCCRRQIFGGFKMIFLFHVYFHATIKILSLIKKITNTRKTNIFMQMFLG